MNWTTTDKLMDDIFQREKSLWPTTPRKWRAAKIPGIFSRETLRNLKTYGTTKIPTQVDPWYMGQILAREWERENEYGGNEYLRFSKQDLNELSFICGKVWPDWKLGYFSGSIFYQPDDATLYLHHLVTSFGPSPQSRLCEALVNSMREAGIKRIVVPRNFFSEEYHKEKLHHESRYVLETSKLEMQLG